MYGNLVKGERFTLKKWELVKWRKKKIGIRKQKL
jgi:hypothetical protein